MSCVDKSMSSGDGMRSISSTADGIGGSIGGWILTCSSSEDMKLLEKTDIEEDGWCRFGSGCTLRLSTADSSSVLSKSFDNLAANFLFVLRFVPSSR